LGRYGPKAPREICRASVSGHDERDPLRFADR
jgi:hypothetical protein